MNRASNTKFVMAYHLGTVYQSTDSGSYHSNTRVSVSDTGATIYFRTGQNNSFTPVGTIYWFASGYEV